MLNIATISDIACLGSLVGVYATNKNGTGLAPAYVSKWRYQGLAQGVDNGVFIPSRFLYPDLTMLN